MTSEEPSSLKRLIATRITSIDWLICKRSLSRFVDPGVADAHSSESVCRIRCRWKQQAVDKLNALLRLELLRRDRASTLVVLSRCLAAPWRAGPGNVSAMKALEADRGNAGALGIRCRSRGSPSDLRQGAGVFPKRARHWIVHVVFLGAIALMHSLNGNLNEVIASAQRAMALKTNIRPRLVAISAAFAAIAAGDAMTAYLTQRFARTAC